MTEIDKKIMIHSYKNIDIKISDFKNIINILIVTNIKLALELSYNLLIILSLAKKNIEIFLRKAS